MWWWFSQLLNSLRNLVDNSLYLSFSDTIQEEVFSNVDLITARSMFFQSTWSTLITSRYTFSIIWLLIFATFYFITFHAFKYIQTLISRVFLQMEDECSIGNDETRIFILSSYASNKMNRVPCVLCKNSLSIYDRYPLLDGTFFLSPKQHSKTCVQVKEVSCYIFNQQKLL